MSDGAIIYTALLAAFILLIIFIRVAPLPKHHQNHKKLMYYKLDLLSRKITIITSIDLEADSKKLGDSNYELIFLSDLETFILQQIKLPDNSFFIALNATYSHSLKQALPALIKENISLIIFLPILISTSSNKYKQEEVQQLNDFIFSEEFKNIFSYTQPNC